MFVCALLVLCAVQFFDGPQVSAYKYQQCPKWWIKRGCRIDYHRSLTALLDDRKGASGVKIDWDNYDAYLYDLACRCRAEAMRAGNKWFALENYGVCFSASGPFSKYLEQYTLDPHHRCIGVLQHNNTIVSQEDGEICTGGYFRAYFYEITNLGAQAPAAAPEEEEEEVNQCKAVSDVLFMVDVSGSVGAQEIKFVKEFLQRFMDAYDFSNGQSRFGLIAYDEKCHVQLNWLDSSNMKLSDMRDVINGLNYTGGSTMTDRALVCAKDKIIKAHQRAKVPKTVIVMTDGESWNGRNRVGTPSTEVRGLGCKVFAIAIGKNVDPVELQMITGAKERIFYLESFKSLIAHAAKHVNALLSKACISS